VLLVTGLVAAVLAGGWWWWRSRSGPPDGFILAYHAINGNRAVVLMRANYQDKPSRMWVARIDADRGLRWWRQLPELAHSVGPYDGMSVDDDLVTIRYSRDEDHGDPNHATFAFATEDGRPRWDVELSRYSPQALGGGLGGHTTPSLDIWMSTFQHGEHLFEVVNDGMARSIVTVDRARGQILARQAFGETPMAPMAAGRHLLVHELHSVAALSPRAEVPAHYLSTGGTGCVVGDEYIALRRQSRSAALVAYRLDDLRQPRVIADPFLPAEDGDSHLSLRSCGHRGDQLVVYVDRGVSDQAMVAIVARDGQVRATIPIGRDMHWDGSRTTYSYPAAALIAGALPRFAFYVHVPFSDPDGPEREPGLLVLDLDEGRVAWQGPENDDLIHWTMFKSGDRYFFYRRFPGWLVSFDGATGRLEAAVETRDLDEVRPYHVADGRIWVASSEWRHLDQPALALLDAATLKPVRAWGLPIADVTAEMRQKLGFGADGRPPAP